jgi:hypothetical protein
MRNLGGFFLPALEEPLAEPYIKPALNLLLTPVAATSTYQNAMGVPEKWKDHPLWK